MIRLLHCGARLIAASLALVAVMCLVVQGASVAGHAPVGAGHAHHGHAHGHSHHGHAHHVHAHAAPSVDVAAVPDNGSQESDQDSDRGAKADFDGLCCGSTTCTATMLASADTLDGDIARGRVSAAGPADAVLGFVPDGLRRPPRTPALA